MVCTLEDLIEAVRGPALECGKTTRRECDTEKSQSVKRSGWYSGAGDFSPVRVELVVSKEDKITGNGRGA